MLLQLSLLFDKLTRNFAEKKLTVVASLDVTKAFDSI